jgi:two-component system repressor protein LuxO
MGVSPAMQEVYRQIEYASGRKVPVFITGETGTGKELCAQAIHKYGRFPDSPFIVVRCCSETPAFDPDEGPHTMFFDNVMELPADLQFKVLCLLQSREDIRFICASHAGPYSATEENGFRRDLFYRLHVLTIEMPPLRRCGKDILDIGHAFLCEIAREEGKKFRDFSHEAEEILINYDWPGNFRELENVIRQTVVTHEGEFLEAGMLPKAMVARVSRRLLARNNKKIIVPLWQTEKKTIEDAIQKCDGNISKAARLLGISPSTIYRKREFWQEKAEKITGKV